MKKPRVCAAKVVLSGDVIETYEYEKGVLYNYEKPDNATRANAPPEDWNGKEECNLRRAKQTLRRLIWTNIGKYTKFLTLTYAENMQDYEKFKKDWQRFIKNMKNNGFSLRYVYVLEYQERGALHAHVVIFNDEYIPIEAIQNAWNRGFVKVNAIRDVNNLGAYVSKYLTKETMAMYGTHSYHLSKGLDRPIEKKIDLDGSDTIEDYAEGMHVTFQSKYSIPVYDADHNIVDEKYVIYKQGRRGSGASVAAG